MLIKRLKIDGFGKLKRRDYKFKPGMNVIYGPNESGKTTLAYFILNALSRPGEELRKYEPWDYENFGGEIFTDTGNYKVDFFNGEFNEIVERDLFETVAFIMEGEKLTTTKEKDAFVISYMKKKMQKNEWGLRLSNAIEAVDKYSLKIQECIDKTFEEINKLNEEISSIKEQVKEYNALFKEKKNLAEQVKAAKELLKKKKEELEILKEDYLRGLRKELGELKIRKESLHKRFQNYEWIGELDKEKILQAREFFEHVKVAERNIEGLSGQVEELEKNLKEIEESLQSKLKQLNVEDENELDNVYLRIKNISLLKKMYDEKKERVEKAFGDNPLWKLFYEDESVVEKLEQEAYEYKKQQEVVQEKLEQARKKMISTEETVRLHRDFSISLFLAAIVTLILGFFFKDLNLWMFAGTVFLGILGIVETIFWRRKELERETITNEVESLTRARVSKPEYLKFLKKYNLNDLKELREKFYEYLQWKAQSAEQKKLSDDLKELESEIIKELKNFSVGSAAQMIDSSVDYLNRLYSEAQKLLLSKASLERELNNIKDKILKQRKDKEVMQERLNKILQEVKLSYDDLRNYEEIYEEYLQIRDELAKIESKMSILENQIENHIYSDEINEKIVEISEIEHQIVENEKHYSAISNNLDNTQVDFDRLLSLLKQRDELQQKLAFLKVVPSNLSGAKRIFEEKLYEYVENYGKKFKEEFSRIISTVIERSLPIVIENNLSVKLTINGDTAEPDEILSSATFDQMLFAYKIALYHSISEYNLPLIIDNAFIRYDDKRLENTIKILKKEASKRQVLLLTSDKRILNYFDDIILLEG
ncbi:AAA family ATPase [Thermosipho ferrireducens]|uniref:AAA family ATPase n=1 Tax=Thermosipho ferrireducens TaxID=2571116 RepID=A0ABX7S8W0_9BACT|nr:AAA family ATPase [Thermosipho ferrireducens]QTA38260.1 AAA family ATPase [Thermosipho ferrireducens]